MNHLISLLEEKLGRQFWKSSKLKKSVLTLNETLTIRRPEDKLNYMQNTHLRRAYLAYYLPLNAEKIKAIVEAHPELLPPKTPQKDLKDIHIVDYGCGPGTATLAVLETLAEQLKKNSKKTSIRVSLIDADQNVLSLAQSLVSAMALHLNLEITIATMSKLNVNCRQSEWTILFAANVINELKEDQTNEQMEALQSLWENHCHTMLLLEPGHRVSSQRLLRFRKRLLQNKKVNLLGPCLHSGECPLLKSQHWCHFAVHADNKQLAKLSIAFFNDKRAWLKFSYLCVSKFPAKKHPTAVYRAIGDIHKNGPHQMAVDLCAPETKKVIKIPIQYSKPYQKNLLRGALVRLDVKNRIKAVSGWPFRKR